ncbi:carbohydrate ABC transporter permease [Acutalibacter muris]|uniref:carbohydrate ABC transporter permease n=1 Tax=Acutalibacter muris TaxID=1796620 RepID=UPI00272BE469|nr:carbohydrate ABC transporter permease [Acutalibacter muris]
MAKLNNKRINEPFGDKVFNVCNYIFLGLSFLVVAYPLIYVFSASFSDSNAVIHGDVWLWPVGFNFRAYETIFTDKNIMTGYMNSFIYTVLGTLFNLVLTTLVAYPLSRKKLFGKRVITWYFMVTMFFSGGLVPQYLLAKDLDLLNTRTIVIILGGLSIYNMIVMRSFLTSSIPDDLYEAAYLDGCSDIGMLFRIVLPLAKPILAVMVLYYAVGHWNDFFTVLIYTSDPKLTSLQLVLRELLIQNKIETQMTKSMATLINRAGMYELLRYAIIVAASVPVLIIYPFVQKHFIKGVMIGSIKG